MCFGLEEQKPGGKVASIPPSAWGLMFSSLVPSPCLSADLSSAATSLGRSSPVTLGQFSTLCCTLLLNDSKFTLVLVAY